MHRDPREYHTSRQPVFVTQQAVFQSQQSRIVKDECPKLAIRFSHTQFRHVVRTKGQLYSPMSQAHVHNTLSSFMWWVACTRRGWAGGAVQNPGERVPTGRNRPAREGHTGRVRGGREQMAQRDGGVMAELPDAPPCNDTHQQPPVIKEQLAQQGGDVKEEQSDAPPLTGSRQETPVIGEHRS